MMNTANKRRTCRLIGVIKLMHNVNWLTQHFENGANIIIFRFSECVILIVPFTKHIDIHMINKRMSPPAPALVTMKNWATCIINDCVVVIVYQFPPWRFVIVRYSCKDRNWYRYTHNYITVAFNLVGKMIYTILLIFVYQILGEVLQQFRYMTPQINIDTTGLSWI